MAEAHSSNQPTFFDVNTRSARCAKCGETKPAEDFQPDARKKNRLHSWCKFCEKARLQKYVAARKKNPPDANVTEKRCRTCKQTKTLDQFYVDMLARYGRDGKCKTCRSEHAKTYRKRLSKDPVWRQKQRRQSRKYNLKRSYKLTHEEYDAMFEAQKGLCAICGKSETCKRLGHSEQVRDLAVDHNHTTGKIRQLLCATCNHGIGSFHENVATLQSAIDYIKRHSES